MRVVGKIDRGKIYSGKNNGKNIVEKHRDGRKKINAEKNINWDQGKKQKTKQKKNNYIYIYMRK